MQSRLFRSLSVVTAGLGLGLIFASAPASAEPKNKSKSSTEAGDKSIDKQMAWEQKVMGEDGAKKADMKKIAAAQKLAEESRKNPPPEPAPTHKDPNKEGVRAKHEASIGLPIESDEAPKSSGAKKTTVAKKSAAPSSSANDELGALVASSLASDKKAEAAENDSADSGGGGNARASRGKSHKARRAKTHGKATSTASAKPDAPSSLDQMFAAGK
jgi:hypothetical protein